MIEHPLDRATQLAGFPWFRAFGCALLWGVPVCALVLGLMAVGAR